jgi:hypothetical protein
LARLLVANPAVIAALAAEAEIAAARAVEVWVIHLVAAVGAIGSLQQPPKARNSQFSESFSGDVFADLP